MRFYEHSLTRRTRIPRAFHAVCFGNYTFFQRQGRRDRFPPSLLKAFCVAPLLSYQRLGTSQTRERMGATLRLATRQHPPNAGPDVHPRDFSCYGVPLSTWDGYPPLRGKPFHRPPGQTCLQDKAQIGTPWTQVQKSRPTCSVPIRCLPWYGSTSHLGTVAKRKMEISTLGSQIPPRSTP